MAETAFAPGTVVTLTGRHRFCRAAAQDTSVHGQRMEYQPPVRRRG